MQRLGLDIIAEARKAKMQELDSELKIILDGAVDGEMFQCPICKYVSKNKKFTAKIFKNADGNCFKCFSCGRWRRI